MESQGRNEAKTAKLVRRLGITLLLAMLVCLTVVVPVSLVRRSLRLSELERKRRLVAETVGEVVEYRWYDHNKISYRFTVNGKTYEGISIAKNNRMYAGRPVVIAYDPADPTYSKAITSEP